LALINIREIMAEGFKLRWASVILSTFLIAACGTASSTSFPTSNPLNTVDNLVGTWTSACQYLGSSVYVLDSVIFTQTTVTETLKAFTDSACTSLSNTTVATASGYSIGASQTYSLTPGNSINFTFSSFTLTPNTTTAAANYNAVGTSGFCGVNTWANGNTVDVTGKTNTSSGCSYPAANVISYQIFTVGNASGAYSASATFSLQSPVNAVKWGDSLIGPILAMLGGGRTSSSAPTWLGSWFMKQ